MRRRHEGSTSLYGEVLRLLKYNPRTGVFTWRVRRGGTALGGAIAGTPTSKGYISIGVLGRVYMAHTLAVLYMTGELPQKPKQVDHINRCKSDNRWCNLRVVSQSVNQHNTGLRKDNALGVRGVRWCSVRNGYRVRLQVAGVSVHDSTHNDLEFAELVSTEARDKYVPQ